GLIAVLFGILTFVWPGITLVTLVFLFGFYALGNGIFTLGVAIRAPKGTPGIGTMVLLGLLGIAAGIVAFVYPGITALSLLSIIAVWAIFTGVIEIAVAIRLRKELANEWMLILSGALSVLFGVLVIVSPGAGALSVAWLIGAYAVAFGIMMLMLAFRVKSLVTPSRTATRTA